MAKNCTYCGQPLAKEDARFCNECGRLQIPEPDPLAAPGIIKVRLPPKEIPRRERSPLPSREEMRFERTPGLPSAFQDQRGQPAPAPQPFSRANRPVRQSNQESQIAEQRSETAGEAASAPTYTSGSTRPPADQPVPVEEISTMVLPGWREELERLRKRQSAASPPVPPETQPPSSLLTPPAAFRPAERNTPLPSSQEPEGRKVPAGDSIADIVPNAQVPESPPSDPLRPEMRFRIWEQRPTIHYPQVQVQKEAEPAPAVEHLPFAPVSDAKGEAEPVAAKASIDWQALSGPVAMPDPEPAVEESTRQIEEDRQEEAEESGVEDLPTVPLAVPEVAKQQPSITIERTSTPAPGKQSPAQEEIEDLPTRPMPASQAGPRSPFPPTAPQSLQSREREQRSAPISMVPNPPSSPGAYRQVPAPPTNTPQIPGVPASPPEMRGRVPAPNSQPGQIFNPASMAAPRGPLSSPGNTAFQPQPPAAQQRPPAFAPAAPRSAETDATPARPRKKRMKPLQITLLVVLIIVAGGGAYVFYYQSSSGGAVAQPYQTFQNSALGVSLNYPQGWTSSVNQGQTSVHFADSSQTGQVTLSIAAQNAQSLTQYIGQQNTQLGITAPQLEPTITFGGASWQQEKGSVVQRGVTYMLNLYATQHGAHIYTLIFIAPPPVYGRMEQENFAPLRTSFRFIGQ